MNPAIWLAAGVLLVPSLAFAVKHDFSDTLPPGTEAAIPKTVAEFLAVGFVVRAMSGHDLVLQRGSEAVLCSLKDDPLAALPGGHGEREALTSEGCKVIR